MANFLCVAVLYVLLHAEFLAVIQVLVYAGGIVVLYLFVVMLVNLKRPPEAHERPAAARADSASCWRGGAGRVRGHRALHLRRAEAGSGGAAARRGRGNVEQMGWRSTSTT